MKQLSLITATIFSLTLLLTSCGGGGSGANDSTQTQISFKQPPVGTTLTFARQVTDNSNNITNLTFSKTINAVNSDGSFTSTVSGQLSNIIVNGSIAVSNIIELQDNTGNLLTETVTSSNPSSLITYSPKMTIYPYPLYVGKTWNSNWTVSSTSSAGSSVVLTNGVVVGTESITVPAGTFNTIKVQYTTVTTPDLGGSITTNARTCWLATDTSYEVKCENVFSYSITGRNGYTVSIIDQLHSFQ